MLRRHFLCGLGAALVAGPSFASKRVSPHFASPWALPSMPRPLSVSGSGLGSVITDRTARQGIEDLYLYGGASAIYVDPLLGKDRSSHGGPSSPVRSLAYALKERSERFVFLVPNGSFDPCEFAFSDPGAGYNLRVISPAPGYHDARIRGSGPRIADLHWSAVSGLAGGFMASVGKSRSINHVIKVDTFNDFGQPFSLPYRDTYEDWVSSISGFFHDRSIGVLYLRDAGADIATNRLSYDALYGGTLHVVGARIIFDGSIRFDGVEFIAKEDELGNPPIVCLSGTKHRFSPGHTVRAIGGILLSENVHTYAGAYDGWNYDPGNVTGKSAFAMEINCRGYGAGDLESYGAIGDENRNGSSAHGGADVVRYAGLYDGNFGPNINDTGLDGYVSTSWNVGCVTARSTAKILRQGFASAGSLTGIRNVWLDTCSAQGDQADLYAREVSNVVKVHEFDGRNSVAAAGAVVLADYDLSSPNGSVASCLPSGACPRG